ncbi:hypothetical protein SAMN06265365_10391 [Tistlia consotensis]|uniref:Uncharacterized protein n=1 Tax=Tistlia consotensis USBA 355 TaxID=560819 RepID=A0A1Y6BM12_9PROT|nr:hypothetical protein [Tistlia consotensis]SMF18047.1 hypothetical protein SAMN05428998_106134 [Tistlia consotensis USBA 355]SNR40003.1 hypothetical protein SAMN06265365_10391 [Tistlia consotensis]
MRSMILAAVAATTLIAGTLSAEANDWRRRAYPGVVIVPGITLQFGQTYVVPAPRYGHERRYYWYGERRWHDRGHHYGWHRRDRWDDDRHRGWHRDH